MFKLQIPNKEENIYYLTNNKNYYIIFTSTLNLDYSILDRPLINSFIISVYKKYTSTLMTLRSNYTGSFDHIIKDEAKINIIYTGCRVAGS